ncbi:ATP-binding cassette domain-containing protein [Caldisphaera sp.]|jgi:ABC-2 type transport system ATP-binding protein|uniref:ABC transporter ATP-binding protein n=1 Tax=Caldisphaera sp. TaxID=2060322 RepID=UPI00397B8E09
MPAIEVRDLVKVYSGGVVALNGVNLTVEEGAFHAILGPNGAGKTTLIRIITTQIKPTKGTIKVFSFDISSYGNRVRELIGYVPQEMSLWTDLTGYENATIYAKIYGIESSRRANVIDEALEFMGLRDAAKRLVKTYSGGMIRRLEIAIALISRPRLIILDEPTIGLDPRARMLIWERLLAYKKEYGITIFFATHYMDEADKYADMVSIINRGKIIAEGRPLELRKAYGVDKIVLRIDGDVDKAKEILSGLDFNARTDNNGEISIVVKEPSAALPKVIENLNISGITVLEARIVEASLDDVFIKLTGEGMFEEEGMERIRDVLSTRGMIRRGG